MTHGDFGSGRALVQQSAGGPRPHLPGSFVWIPRMVNYIPLAVQSRWANHPKWGNPPIIPGLDFCATNGDLNFHTNPGPAGSLVDYNLNNRTMVLQASLAGYPPSKGTEQRHLAAPADTSYAQTAPSASTVPTGLFAEECDDPFLTETGLRVFLDGILAVVPAGISAFQSEAFREVAAGNFTGDPRWLGLYGSEIYMATLCWLGSRVLLAAGRDPSDASFSTAGLTLQEVSDRLELRFARILRRELARFWNEAGAFPDTADPQALHSVENLALQWSMVTAATFADLQMSRVSVAQSFLKQLIAIWKRTGFPQEPDPENCGLDDLLISYTAYNTFWICVIFEYSLAYAADTPPSLDPTEGLFGDVPLQLPPPWVAETPAPSARPVNGPVSSNLLHGFPRFRSWEFFSWLDPTSSRQPSAETRAAILRVCVGDLPNVGDTYLATLLSFGAQKVAEYQTWLKKEAGLTMLEVLAARQMIYKAGQTSGVDEVWVEPSAAELAKRPRRLSRAALEIINHLAGNPHVSEAVRRHVFLSEALSAIKDALPANLLQAARTGDLDGLSAALPKMKGEILCLFIGTLAFLSHTLILLLSPEPFENLRELSKSNPAFEASSLASDDSSDDEETDRDSDTPLDIWFRSPAFAMAFQRAIVISNYAKMMLRYPPASLQHSLCTGSMCYAATYAAWLNVRVLRRFRRLVATSPGDLQSGAIELHDSLISDTKACLELLEAVGKVEYQSVRVILQGLLDGEDIRLTRRDLQMLRMARKVASRCPHQSSGSSEGECWICTSSRTARWGANNGASEAGLFVDEGDDNADEEGEPDLDPLATLDRTEQPLKRSSRTSPHCSSSESSDSRPAKKRVTFAPLVSIHETYHKEDYLARSMLAPDDPELMAAPIKEVSMLDVKSLVSGGLSLATLMEQRKLAGAGLPNLRAFW